MSMTPKLDIILFGATGYTGKFVLLQLHKFAKGFTWGIAGRNEKKLKATLVETSIRVEHDGYSKIPIILADADNEKSIKKMTAKAKIVINCCGPFDLYGEVVVKSCIATGTHYVDICGEIQFIDRIVLKYGNFAKQKGVFIVSACGYDCICTDLGICFIENNFSGTVNTVDTYMQLNQKSNHVPGIAGNFGTWASFVNFLGSTLKILFNRRKLDQFKHMKLLEKVDNNWACPFPTADMDIVHRSQQFFYEHDNKRPVQMHNYLLLSALKYVVLCIIFVFVVGIFGQFKFGRRLLLQYPNFFTFGMVEYCPSEEKINQIHFSVKFKCRGWSNKLPEVKDQYVTPPNKEIFGHVSGVNPGYGFTSLAVTLSALVILTEENKMPPEAGILTPAMAFSKTSLIQQLQNNGVIFEVLSIKDIP